MKRWLLFINQRFNPVTYLVTITFYLLAHIVIIQNIYQINISWVDIGILYVATVTFFLLLRIYDDVKDYEVDKKMYKDRPLITGLVSVKEAKQLIVLLIIFSYILFLFVSIQAAMAYTVTLGYSLLMYKEFFVRTLLRKHLILYAVTHTFVSSILSVSLLSAISNLEFWKLPLDFYLFALGSWCVFNIFEFGRKTYASSEEQKDRDSYSKNYTKLGAVLIVLLMIVCIHLILIVLKYNQETSIHLAIISWFMTLSVIYLHQDTQRTGQIYRSFCSIYPIIIYILMSSHYWS